MYPMEPSPGSAKLSRKPSQSLRVLNVVATQTPVVASSGIRSHHQPNCLHQKPSPLQAPCQAQEGSHCDLVVILTDWICSCRHRIKSNCLHLAITPRDFGWSLWDKRLVYFFTGRSLSASSWYMLLTNLARADVALRTNYVSGSVQKCYPSFAKALQVYTMKYNKGVLQAVPLPGGPFFQLHKASFLPPSPTLSEEEMWEQIDGKQEERQSDRP